MAKAKEDKVKIDNDFADQAVGPSADDKRPYVIFYDPEIRGFGLRVTKSGAKSWILNYRAKGVERRLTVGTFRDPWRAAAARKEALRLKALIDQGRDPMGERHQERAAPTVNDLITRWRADHATKNRPSTTRENERLIAQWIKPALGSKKVADIGFEEVEALHQKVSKQGTPYRANRVLALLSKLFSLAVKWRMTAVNPVKGVDRNHEEPRSTYLDEVQLEQLLKALDTHTSKTAANLIRLLILTGCRSGEAFAMTWGHLELPKGCDDHSEDRPPGIWTKPVTKQGTPHRAVLSPDACELLTRIKTSAANAATSSIFVFPAKKGGPLKTIRNDWAAICQAAGLENVRVHDLRHSFASYLASSGLSLVIIGQLLGHRTAQTTLRYSHPLDKALRAAASVAGEKYRAAAGKAS
jgi:integrase